MTVTLRESDSLVKLWMENDVCQLDVRPLLEAGGEPYSCIMRTLLQLEPGNRITIHTLFEPKPLLTQAERMGYEPRCRRMNVDHWIVEMRRPTTERA